MCWISFRNTSICGNNHVSGGSLVAQKPKQGNASVADLGHEGDRTLALSYNVQLMDAEFQHELDDVLVGRERSGLCVRLLGQSDRPGRWAKS